MAELRRTAVVTGGSAGIGLAIVERLLCDGYRVGFFGSDAGRVEAARTGLLSAGVLESELFAQAVDLRCAPAIQGFFGDLERRLGPASILVNNAGISPKEAGRRIPAHETPLTQWQDVMAVNLTGAFLSSQQVLPGMKAAGYGRIVMIGSIAARAWPRFAGAAYVASKAGLAGLTRSLAAEYGGLGITTNTVAPGNIATGMTGDPDSSQNQAVLQQIPAGRIGLPKDLPGIVAFLCSEEAGFINGATIDVTGGEYMAS
ncbi:MAG TPA: SDR family oxidoreductase [Kiloniellaceae bacterium]|nr:SDR family oxidoreductase [Kiloniellaceae bacterium]HIP77885.1 SDR family oxidoreductase [Kiloniellaceae bacterium]